MSGARWRGDSLVVIMRKIFVIGLGAVVLVASFAGALFVMNAIWPSAGPNLRPVLADVAPLPQMTRSSVVIAPVAVSLNAIREQMEAVTPRNSAGTKEASFGQILSNAEIGWTITRGPLSVAGRPDGLSVSMPLNGTLRLTGQLAQQGGGLAGALGNVLGSDVGRQLQNLTGRALEQGAQIRGNVLITARPAITPEWRLQPNLAGQVSIADAALAFAGLRINVANEVRPLLERSVADQVAALQEQLRADPILEQAARSEWARMCRAIPIGVAGSNLPNLWLEVRPSRAFAAQPRADAAAVTLVLGIQAETRIVPTQTRPDCPFPAKLELVAPIEQGRVSIAVPIDVPFTEVNRLVEAQLKGKTFPEDGSGSVDVTVNRVTVTPSGDRLLISLRVKAREKRSFFGFGAEADVHVWGRPVLDREKQMLRLADVTLDVQSEAAFGLLGAAARAAMPYLQGALAESAVIDLKPFAASAGQSVTAALAEFRKQSDAIQVDAAVTEVKLTDIAFDAKILRIIAEAQGTAKVAITSLASR